MDSKKVIEVLVEYKVKNRLTDAQLSEMLGIPLSTINAWIRGKRNPSLVATKVLEEFLKNE